MGWEDRASGGRFYRVVGAATDERNVHHSGSPTVEPQIKRGPHCGVHKTGGALNKPGRPSPSPPSMKQPEMKPFPPHSPIPRHPHPHAHNPHPPPVPSRRIICVSSLCYVNRADCPRGRFILFSRDIFATVDVLARKKMLCF